MSPSFDINAGGMPVSSIFEVRETKGSGRGVFALQNIPKGTPLLETSKPATWVIYDEYAKEVCAQCFAYDRGKAWKIRNSDKGIVFCSDECQTVWQTGMSEDENVAYVEIQTLLRRRHKNLDPPIAGNHPHPSIEAVEYHWEITESMANDIRACRMSAEPTKKQRRTLRHVQDTVIEEHYVIWYMFQGLIHAMSSAESWKCVEQLAVNIQPYKDFADLTRSSQAYLSLLAVLPETILPYVTQRVVRSIEAHSSYNVFGLRSLDEGGEVGDAGSECFGYGLWPLASYWNHSCSPNVQKQRLGRTWRFWASKDIRMDQELCISYLGGDERSLDANERKAKLKDVWGFECVCLKCLYNK